MIFKYINYLQNAKEIYEKPDEFASDTSIGFISGFFVMSMLVLGLLSGSFLFSGFYFDILFLKIIGFLVLILLVVDFLIFRFIKRTIKRTSKKVKEHLGKKFVEYSPYTQKTQKVIDIEIQNHE